MAITLNRVLAIQYVTTTSNVLLNESHESCTVGCGLHAFLALLDEPRLRRRDDFMVTRPSAAASSSSSILKKLVHS